MREKVRGGGWQYREASLQSELEKSDEVVLTSSDEAVIKLLEPIN